MRARALWSALIFLAALLGGDSFAQGGGTSDADWLRREAKADRDYADQLAGKAKSWHDLAAQARANAAATSDGEFQASWNKDAQFRDYQGGLLDGQVADLEAKAQTKETQASSLDKTAANAAAQRLSAMVAAKTAAPAPKGPTLQESYRGQADLQRKMAARYHDFAGRWRGAARHMQATTRKAGQAMQAAVAESVALYELQSKTLDDQAGSFDQAAKSFDHLAAATPPDRPELDEQKTQMAEPDAFVGRWITKNPKSGLPDDIRITALNLGGSPPTLALNSNRFRWIGLYDDNPKPAHGRVDFRMEPFVAAKAMNLDIPLWARQQVQGDLEWRAEVNTVEVCGPQQIQVTWYPGEVSWDNAKHKAWVTGRGNPIVINYTIAEDPPEEAKGVASVSIVAASSNDGLYAPLRAVGRGLPFRVQVILPSFMGDDEGNNIRADIKGAGGRFDVALEGSRSASGAWIYRSDPLRFTRIRGWDERAIQAWMEVAISAMKQQPPHFGVLSKGASGNEIEFATKDGETISVSVVYGGGVSHPLLVYDNPASFAKYEIRRALDDYEIGYRTAALGAGTDSAAVENRLGLITNARAFMNYAPAAHEVWPDYMASEIGLVYLSLLRGPDKDIAVNPTIEGENAQGIEYRATKERDAVEARIAAIKSARLSTYIADLKSRLQSGVDHKALANQFSYFDVEDIKVVVLGEDWTGARVDRTTRILAGTRMSLQVFADLAGAYSLTHSLEEAAATTAREALAKDAISASEQEFPEFAREIESANLLQVDELLPDETNAAKPKLTVEEILPDETNAAKPKPTVEQQPAKVLSAEQKQAKAEAMKKLEKAEPGSFKNVPVSEPEGTFPRPIETEKLNTESVQEVMNDRLGLTADQYEVLNIEDQTNINHASGGGYCVKNGCTLASMTYLLEKMKAVQVAANTLHEYLLNTIGLDVVSHFGANMKAVKNIMEKMYGALEGKIHTYTARTGFEFVEKGLAKGNKFVAAIRYAGTKAGKSEMHAVVITNYEKIAGKELITFYDINARSEIRMGCDLFRDKLLLRAYPSTGPNGTAAMSEFYEVAFKK